MAMEMQARESTNMSVDLTLAIAPYAAALHGAFLHSHCSSCFHAIPSHSHCIVSCTMCCSVRYCCEDCLSSDSVMHSSSGECCFFVNFRKASHSCIPDDTGDFRVALRLLYLLEVHGLVSSDSAEHFNRIGGLLASDVAEILEEGGEVAERILEGSLLMSSVRKMKEQTAAGLHSGMTVERVALWAVMTNSVEVQVSEGHALGMAVYGPSFSWFNHSCSPNASYRFVLAPFNEECTSSKSRSRVVPASKGDAPDAWHAWQHGVGGSILELCKYGPRVVVRSLKPIKKGDEVCITYIDLRQTKEARHSDLRSKYKFVCSCQRCTASPELYVDFILTCDARSLNLLEEAVTAPEIENLDGILDQAISEYSLGNDPKACCDMIESMLSKNSVSVLQQEEHLGGEHMLHPLHHISLRAYITLASAYRYRSLSLSTCYLHEKNNSDFFEMARAAAAYSFVLTGATHHLFLSEHSFMAPLSHFLLSTGEYILDLVGIMKGETSKKASEDELILASNSASSANRNSLQYHEFASACEEYGKCIFSLSLQCWPFLVRSLHCLEKIKNPVDFSWLGTAIFQPQHYLYKQNAANLTSTDKLLVFEEDQRECLFSLAVCCIRYCKYLASICYGPQHYLADRAKDMLEGISILESTVEMYLGE